MTKYLSEQDLKKFNDISNKTTIFDVKDDVKDDKKDDVKHDVKHDDTYNISIKKRSMDYLSKKIKNDIESMIDKIPKFSMFKFILSLIILFILVIVIIFIGLRIKKKYLDNGD